MGDVAADAGQLQPLQRDQPIKLRRAWAKQILQFVRECGQACGQG